MQLTLLVIVTLGVLTFMIKKLGARFKSTEVPSERLFLTLTIWLLAGFGLVITVLSLYNIYLRIAG